MDVNSNTTLSNSQSPVNYKSFEGLPQLIMDDILTKDHNSLQKEHCQDKGVLGLTPSPDLGSLPKEVVLKQLASGSPDLAGPDRSFFRETDRDPLSRGPSTCSPWQGGLMPIYAAAFTIAIAVTIAMVMQIYLWTNEVFKESVLVTDHEHCTLLGRSVLNKQGSSVDSAIVAALCLGIVHPHVSGIGGGGVMLVHDIGKNRSRVINFQTTAPSSIQDEMLQENLELKPGLLVGVPGMLRGLHKAHKLYGRLPWKDLVKRVANVAKAGFNVSHSLAEAISKMKGQNMSGRFRDMFLAGGHALAPGALLKTPSLAAVLEAGVSEFYNGNLMQEIANEVLENGGVLTKEDLSNYSAVVEQPMAGLYKGFRVLVPPPPSVGAALISALNILEELHLKGNNTAYMPSAHHWIAESLKAALAMASGLGDTLNDPSVSELLSKMLSKAQAALLRQSINDSYASPPEHYSTLFDLQSGSETSQVMVMGADDLIVSVASSLNRPFGSRILTPSGILLNSHILDFSWSNKTQGLLQPNPRNRLQPKRRPLSFLMPTVVTPSLGICGIYIALASSNGDHGLSGITQVLINVLSFHKNLNDSIALGRLHPQLLPSSLLVDSEFLEEDVQVLHQRGHVVQRVGVLSVVHGIQRTNDIIRGMGDPRALDSSFA